MSTKYRCTQCKKDYPVVEMSYAGPGRRPGRLCMYCEESRLEQEELRISAAEEEEDYVQFRAHLLDQLAAE